MSFTPIRLMTGLSSVGCTLFGAYTFNKQVQAKYPPQIENFTNKDFYEIDGKKYHIWGYFGGPSSSVDNINLKTREIYLSPQLFVAQKYADMAKHPDVPKTALLVGIRPPRYHDHGPQRFEGAHHPYRPDALQDAQVRVARVDQVNDQTRVGFFASMKRAYQAWKNKSL